jgi:hypothetical protein
MTSRADQHDVDKLGRWRRDLVQPARAGFPAWAIFLVSADDRAAHDIFRRFRTSFEARNAGFGNLVIFGQHGVSTTVKELMPELGLPPESLPALALVNGPEGAEVYTLPLPPGESTCLDAEPPDAPWRRVLAAVEAAADAGQGQVDLLDMEGVARRGMTQGSLLKLVDKLMDNLG